MRRALVVARTSTGDQDKENARQDAVGRDREDLLERVDGIRVGGDEEETLAPRRVEVPEPVAAVVEEKDREWEGERDRIETLKQALQAIRYTASGIGKHDVDVQRIAELAEQEDRERQLVVAVPELPGQEREARCHHQGPESVVRSAAPRDEAGDEEGPRRDDACPRSHRRGQGQVVDLNLVGDDAQSNAGERQDYESDAGRPLGHLGRIFIDRWRRFHRAHPEGEIRVYPEGSPRCARLPQSPTRPSLGA